MKWLQKESVRYALLLVALLTTAAVSVTATLGYIAEIVKPHEHLIIATIIWALTLGFMLIAGAFGLWAIHFAAEAESLRRLGRMVDNMVYIRDGVIALDRQGHITGMNPAGVAMLGKSARGKRLTHIDAPITPHQMQMLLNSEIPIEIETTITHGSDLRSLRIRSQPAKGIIILLFSDVTALVRQREQTRRSAFLQLIGHMAKGVANDFNDLLCGISGHASLLLRQGNADVEVPASARAIQDCADRGILLARQLMQLTAGDQGEITATIATVHHIQNGIDLLKAILPANWTLACEISPDIGPVNIPPAQLEHLVQSLGLAAAENVTEKNFLAIRLSRPTATQRLHQNVPIAAVLTVATHPLQDAPVVPSTVEADPTGIIFSVVSALLQQGGGILEYGKDHQGNTVCQARLPEADPTALMDESTDALALGLAAYAAKWHILVDEDIQGAADCIRYLEQAGIRTLHARGITHILGAIEKNECLDAMAISAAVLGDDTNTLLKAIAKLTPKTGIVLQQELDNEHAPIPGIVYIPAPAAPDSLLHAMIEARSRIRTATK